MARIRYIKPEFFDDEDLSSTSAFARLAFAGLWTQADRDGRLKDEPGRLRVRLFPFEPTVHMDALLNELAAIEVLVRYETDGVRYLAIPGFDSHQKPHPKEPKSKIPPPTSDQTTVSRERSRQNTAGTGTIPSSPGGREQEGKGIGRGGGPIPPPPQPSEHPPQARSLSIIKPIPGWAIWVGDRLHVPSTWHDRHIGMLGGADAQVRLLTWYEQEDALLVRTQTPVRDWFKWLDARYAVWVPDTAAAQAAGDDAVQRDIAEARTRRESVR